MLVVFRRSPAPKHNISVPQIQDKDVEPHAVHPMVQIGWTKPEAKASGPCVDRDMKRWAIHTVSLADEMAILVSRA